VLFHAGVEQLSGGFVGVDIFFVISGFLITSIIAGEIAEGRFSLARFYARRVARIMPALMVMLAICLAVGSLILFPTALRSLGESTAAAALFVPNLYFWVKADYFSTNADLQAMLHTWSLGVEEQYYIFYPFLLVLLSRFGRRATIWGVSLAVLSSFAFCLALVLMEKHRGAFYFLPSRAWELGLGALVALKAHPRIASPALRNAAAVAGFGCILLSLFVVSSSKGFPAPGALLPCLGAALLIAYGETAVTAKLLGLAPMLWTGRVSYSLYLWHWPVIFFYRWVHGATLTPWDSALLVAISLAAAFASYFLVERPFLRGLRHAAPRRTLPGGLAAALCTLVLGMTVSANAREMRHYDPRIQHILSFDDYTSTEAYRYQFRTGQCFIDNSTGGARIDPKCLTLSDDKPNLVIAGDSLAAHVWRAFALRFPERHVIQATAATCRPTLEPVGARTCRAVVNEVLGPMAESGKVEAIVLAGNWTDADMPKLERTIRLLRGRNIRVTVLGPTLQYDGQYPDMLARAILRKDFSMLTEGRVAERKQMSGRMAALVRGAGGTFVSVQDLECPDGECRLTAGNGAPVNFDCCHLTLPMSIEIVRQIPAP
jgi:peptidoglycan/LPS O-acetylase OafA/YrhL